MDYINENEVEEKHENELYLDVETNQNNLPKIEAKKEFSPKDINTLESHVIEFSNKIEN